MLESFWIAKKPVLSLLIFIPELGSMFAGTGTFLRVGVSAYRRVAEWATAVDYVPTSLSRMD